LKWAG